MPVRDITTESLAKQAELLERYRASYEVVLDALEDIVLIVPDEYMTPRQQHALRRAKAVLAEAGRRVR